MQNLDKQKEENTMLLLIKGCIEGDRDSQRMLYQHYYSYSLSICLRYANNIEDAREILNDAFMKVFGRINQFSQETEFKSWLRRILINTAIDHYRKNVKHLYQQDISTNQVIDVAASNMTLNNLAYEELMEMILRLPLSYRTVFNLYVIDGYTHEEIANQLEISSGTSKSHLSKAREKLRAMIEYQNRIIYA